jgi:lysozyme family protein
MSEVSWPAALAFVWLPNNDGQGYHCDPGDPGGATSWGVTHATWSDAVATGLVAGDLANATQKALALVLHEKFWKPCRCDLLAPGDDLAVFNFGMAAGIGRAERVLQSVVGVPVDGDVGPVTLAAVAALPPTTLTARFTAAEEAFYAHCGDAPLFLRGWDGRADRCQVECMKLAGWG